MSLPVNIPSQKYKHEEAAARRERQRAAEVRKQNLAKERGEERKVEEAALAAFRSWIMTPGARIPQPQKPTIIDKGGDELIFPIDDPS